MRGWSFAFPALKYEDKNSGNAYDKRSRDQSKASFSHRIEDPLDMMPPPPTDSAYQSQSIWRTFSQNISYVQLTRAYLVQLARSTDRTDMMPPPTPYPRISITIDTDNLLPEYPLHSHTSFNSPVLPIGTSNESLLRCG